MPALAAGWMRVLARSGAAGADGVTVEAFSRGVEGRIQRLSEDLRAGDYHPQRPRVIAIPKASGGQRILRVPSLRDRVVQSAVAMTLSPVLEPTFEDSSFGYRPGRSIQAAARRILSLRQQGLTWVVEADIDDFFDTIPHDLLLGKLEDAVDDQDVSQLVSIWLSTAEPDGVGIAQGSPLSPLLANLYLDGVDEALRGDDIAMIRYADDFVLMCRSEEVARSALSRAISVTREHGLMLDADKTRIVHYDDGFRFLGHFFSREGAIYEAMPHLSPTVSADRGPLTSTAATPVVDILADLPAAMGRDGEPVIPPHDDDEYSRPSSGRYAERLRRLYLMGNGLLLRVAGQSFRVMNGEEHVADVPPARVDRIQVGPDASINGDALRHALTWDIGIDFVDGRGRALGHLERSVARSAKRHLAQAAVRLDPARQLGIVKSIVRGRVHNQRALLSRLNRRRKSVILSEAAKAIGRVTRKIDASADVNMVRGHEGEASRLFWPAYGSIFGELSFVKRQRGGTSDPVNTVLDIVSGLLQRDIRGLLQNAGLHAGIGFLHVQDDTEWSLAADLVEEFRGPVAEALAAYLFSNRFLGRQNFATEPGGAGTILADGMLTTVRQFEYFMERELRSPLSGEDTTWRGVIEDQIYHLAAVIDALDSGEDATYRPYRMDY